MHPQRVQLLLRFGYDGSRFHGLQPQKALPTAGGTLKERLAQAAGQPPRALCFAARTDAGVHALSNLATCWFVGPLDRDALLSALAQPRDDGLLFVRGEVVPAHIHARGAARGKRYRYVIDQVQAGSSLESPHSWQITPQLDVDRMREAAAFLVGTHDFSSFRGARCAMKNPVKTLSRIHIRGPHPLPDASLRIFIELSGDAFLRKMVRNIVGCLAEVGAGLRTPAEVPGILAAAERQAAGITAPARGLTLLRVGCAWPADGSRLLAEVPAEQRGVGA